jgi:flavin reductase (DIM6/NTAB) family NADH-FMN oxidoreductase RutF
MELADKASFRDAMAHVGAAVNIITTDGPAGRAGSPPARSAALPTRRRPCWSA